MTFLIKIHLLNWQQNVYQSTSCPQNWASVFTSYTNMQQSQVVITFEKHKLAEECIKVLQIEHINYRPVTGGRCIEAKARPLRGQGPDFGSSSCPRARGQSSRTPSLVIAISIHVLMSHTWTKRLLIFGRGIYTDIPPSLRPWYCSYCSTACRAYRLSMFINLFSSNSSPVLIYTVSPKSSAPKSWHYFVNP